MPLSVLATAFIIACAALYLSLPKFGELPALQPCDNCQTREVIGKLNVGNTTGFIEVTFPSYKSNGVYVEMENGDWFLAYYRYTDFVTRMEESGSTYRVELMGNETVKTYLGNSTPIWQIKSAEVIDAKITPF